MGPKQGTCYNHSKLYEEKLWVAISAGLFLFAICLEKNKIKFSLQFSLVCMNWPVAFDLKFIITTNKFWSHEMRKKCGFHFIVLCWNQMRNFRNIKFVNSFGLTVNILNLLEDSNSWNYSWLNQWIKIVGPHHISNYNITVVTKDFYYNSDHFAISFL